jgi:hypothetical protein
MNMDNFNFNFTPGQPTPQPPQPGQKDQKKQPEPTGEVVHLMEQGNVAMRRLRMLEERNSTLQRKNQLTDQNMLAHQKKVATDIRSINQEIGELKEEVAKLKDTMLLVIQELKESAKKNDIVVLEKYLKLWEPVRFVTQNQVERIVKDLIDDHKEEGSAGSQATPDNAPSTSPKRLQNKIGF